MSEPRRPRGIDPRGPRFAASVTTVLLAIAVVLSLAGTATASPLPPLADRVADPGFVLIAVIALIFLWSVLSPRTAPWGVVYRRLVQPRLKPPTELEDPRPPRFAQGVGLFVTAVGLVLHVAGVPWALPVAAAMAFAAAFLNAVFGLCLGCQLYLLLQRAGVLGRRRPASA